MTGHSHRKSDSTTTRLLIIFTLIFALAACGGPQAPQESEEAEPAPLPETAEEVTLEATEAMEAPTAADAVVVYLSGEVVQVVDGEARELSLGDTLQENAVLQVEEESYAEIQVGDRALLRVEANTQITFNRLAVTENRMRAAATVDEGALMSRVERLTGRDSFAVRTDGVVAGVRGTRFRVQVGPEGESTIAVEEGRVSLLPPALDIDALIERYGEEANVLRELAPVVDEAQQITISPEALRPVSDQLSRELQEADTDADAISRAFENAGASLARETPAADQINPESQRALRDLAAQQFVSLRTEAQPSLLPLSLTAEPSEARIIVRTPDGRELVSRGRFSGLFEEGEDVSVTVRADGYQSRELELTMESNRGYSASITLPESEDGGNAAEEDQEEQPAEGDEDEPEAEAADAVEAEEPELSLTPTQNLDLPQPVFLTILTRPGNARIIRNGEQIGEGSAFIETEVGAELSLRAELEGYTATERSVSVTSEMEPLIEIPLEAEVTTERISVVTNPSSAQIELNGENVGRGRFSDEFETGRQLTFTAEAEGYFPGERSITVRPGTEGTYRLELEEEPRIKEITIAANPPSTRITVNGRFAGRGRHTAKYDWGDTLTIDLSAPGYIATTEAVTVREEGPSRYRFNLEPEPRFATLTVRLVPGDGELFINGTGVDGSEVTREFEEGARITVAAERPGFRSREEQLTLDEDRTLELQLEPEPIERRVDFGGAAIVRGIEPLSEGVIFADARGRVYRYDLQGQEIWSYESANRPNENSLPVVRRPVVFFTGAAQAVALSVEDGTVLHQQELGERNSHLFGRTVTPLGSERALFPDNAGISLINPASGEVVRRVEIPGGARSSAAAVDEKRAVVVDQGGVFHLIDIDAGEILNSVGTGLVQPVAAKPALSGEIAVAVDRRGNGAAVHLVEGTVLWERKIAPQGLFSNPVVVADTVYFTAGEILFAIDPSSGESRFDAVEGSTTPPAFLNEAIYVGRGTKLTEMDPLTGTVRRELDLEVEIAGRPAAIGERIIVGTNEGSFILVNRTAWEALELSD